MITYRVEIQLIEETTILDVWSAFCNWRKKSKYCNPTEKAWFSQNSGILRTENISFKSNSKQGSSQIKRIYDEAEKILAIQYIQDESKKGKTFTTTIVVNLSLNAPAMSLVIEESPITIKEFHKKRGITKPNLFAHIEPFVDKKYVPLDPFGKPKPFTPSIFVSSDIPKMYIDSLCEKYKHTANIRKTNHLNCKSDLGTEDDYIISKKNMSFICHELTWNYVMASLDNNTKALLSKIEILEIEIPRPVPKFSKQNIEQKSASKNSSEGRKKIVIRKSH